MCNGETGINKTFNSISWVKEKGNGQNKGNGRRGQEKGSEDKSKDC